MNERKSYKQDYALKEMKKGQVTIFVIAAVVIVVGAVLIFLFRGQISETIFGEVTPNSFLSECVEDEVRGYVETLAKQGGYNEPEGYIMWKDYRVKYLCYTSKYYEPCLVQQPMIKQHFEDELREMIGGSVRGCVQEMKETFEGRGYEVSAPSSVSYDVKIVPRNIQILVDAPISLTKDTTQTFTEFEINMRSEMYGLLMIATSIIDYESTYGDSETSIFIQYYPSLIEKTKLTDGSKIYVVRDVTTHESFTFASRGLSWPAGYGIYD